MRNLHPYISRLLSSLVVSLFVLVIIGTLAHLTVPTDSHHKCVLLAALGGNVYAEDLVYTKHIVYSTITDTSLNRVVSIGLFSKVLLVNVPLGTPL